MPSFCADVGYVSPAIVVSYHLFPFPVPDKANTHGKAPSPKTVFSSLPAVVVAVAAGVASAKAWLGLLCGNRPDAAGSGEAS